MQIYYVIDSEICKSWFSAAIKLRHFRCCMPLLFCIFFNCSISIQAQTSGITNSTVDSIKSFLQSRPVIDKIVFDRQVLAVPHIPGVNLPANQGYQHYQASWSPSGFYIRRLNDLADLDTLVATNTITAGLLFAGENDKAFWQIVNTNLYFTPLEIQGSASNFVAQTTKNASFILSTALNLGVERLIPGSLTWDGDDFNARSDFGCNMHGHLIISNDLPAQIEVKYDGFNFEYSASYVYDKSNPLSLGFPNTVYEVFMENGQIIPQYRETFLSVEAGTNDSISDFLKPEHFFVTAPQEIYYTNSTRYIMHNGVSGGVLQVAPPTAKINGKQVRLIIYTAFGLVTTGLLLFLLLNKKNEANKRTNKGTNKGTK